MGFTAPKPHHRPATRLTAVAFRHDEGLCREATAENTSNSTMANPPNCQNAR
jgi:hypothetical protein